MTNPMLVALPHKDDLTHPVGFLMEKLAMALAAVAPERVEELNKITAGLTLRATNDDSFICRYSPDSRTIEVSRRVVEALWCASYAYFKLYETLNAVANPTSPVDVDLTADEAVRKAMKLLKWAISCVLGEKTPWPPDCPVPAERAPNDDPNAIASELALVAAAFMLHHELAHHRHGHVGLRAGPESIEQERQADFAAAAWILGDRSRMMQAEFHKRSLGIAIGLSLLVALGIHSGAHGGDTHPLDFDRLVHTLSLHVTDPQDAAWAMPMAILKLHMDNMKIEAPRMDYATCRDAVEDYANILADRAAERAEVLKVKALFAL